MPIRVLFLLFLLSLVAVGVCPIVSQADDDTARVFFESKVRPLLASHCTGCHSADDQQGGVRLDVRSGVFGKVAGNPVVSPSDVANSRLLKVIQYDDNDIQMPPDGVLPETDRNILRRWVETGAYWPAGDEAPALADPFPRREDGSIDFAAAAASHWSYQPIQEVSPPTGVADHPVDAFVARRLRGEGLALSERARPQTLVRRFYFDVLGMPPTCEQAQAFLSDPSPAATAALVDQLLDDPRYGERWARHWLDVARYADTTGYRTANKSREYANAYTYRDWVVSSLNADMGYDDFVQAQIAADLIWPDDPAQQAALGFLSVGPVFTDNRVEQINDQIDVVTRGMMGMTMVCARCHDHKFDPVPTSDYYSLYGVFDSTRRVDEGLAIPVSYTSDGLENFRKQLREKENKLRETKEAVRKTIQDDSRTRLPDYLVAAAVDLKVLPGSARPKLEPDLRARSVRGWGNLLKNRNSHPAVRMLWEFASVREAADFPTALQTKAGELIGPNKRFPQAFVKRLVESPPASFEELLRQLAERMQAGDEEVVGLFDIKPAPTAYAAHEVINTSDRDLQVKIQKADKAIDDLWANHPDAPPKAMIVSDSNPHDVRVFIRGNIGRRGDVAPRRFPQIFSEIPADGFRDGSGRLALAKAVVDPRNPLTARVIVNRVWKHYFGRGLVTTPSDFGIQGEAPSHPQLLDYFASQLIANDWSLKWLHRQILLSDTYQQASDDRPDARAADPDNRLLWRQNRKRLEFEPMRDAMLSVAGMLDPKVGGKAVPLDNLSRRSIYLKVDRNNPPELTRTFDVPDADQTSPGRSETLVPQQALFYLNNKQVLQITENVVKQIGQGTPQERAKKLFQVVLARDPSDREHALLSDLMKVDVPGACQVLLMSNEFLFVD